MKNRFLVRFSHKFYVSIVVFMSFWGIGLFFMTSSKIQEKMAKYLRVDPTFTGGELAQTFEDYSGVSFPFEARAVAGAGAGAALSANFDGTFDLCGYSVYEPVTGARWQKNAEYWQLVLDYKAGPDFARNIMIYIDLDNIPEEAGSLNPLFEGGVQLSFDKAHPWDFAVWLCDGEGAVYDSAGEFICETENYSQNNETRLKLRIPLKNKRLQKVLGAGKTYHYVVTSVYSQYETDGFMKVDGISEPVALKPVEVILKK